jgi:glucosylceramidase
VAALAVAVSWVVVSTSLGPGAQADGPRAVSSWLTTPDQASLLAVQPAVRWGATATPGVPVVAVPTITVDDGQRFQTMSGFGASLTDSSAAVISALPVAQRDALMQSLFSRTRGIGLSYLRQPLGASDFATKPYTYDDLPAGQSDPTLTRFSIAHDGRQMLPLVRQARSLNPSLGVMLSPWSPPAWMKTNGSLNGGSLKPGHEPVLADYLIRSVRAWRAAGVPVDAVTIENEPENATADYPSMVMTSAQQALVIADLGPKLATASPTTAVVAYDHNWSNPSYPLAVLADPAAAPWTDGTAWHCYTGDASAQSVVHDAFPAKDVYFTECSGYDGAPHFATNLKWGIHTLVIGATRNWAKTVIPFNLALDDRHGPTIGGCPDCRGVVTVNSRTGAVTRNVEYWYLGHVARFVRPGAVRIASTDLGVGSVESVAFQNPDGSHVLIVFNGGTGTTNFDVATQGRTAPYSLAPGAVATLTW